MAFALLKKYPAASTWSSIQPLSYLIIPVQGWRDLMDLLDLLSLDKYNWTGPQSTVGPHVDKQPCTIIPMGKLQLLVKLIYIFLDHKKKAE